MSDPKAAEYQEQCDHNHERLCIGCERLKEVHISSVHFQECVANAANGRRRGVHAKREAREAKREW